ncbi:SDR family oxidoreductase [Streptomyces sp. NPDC052036]|uniref:SDR family NAD(P)-dependent oxidoreductase n=1 Tax=Streptomyces sp. NPDC052036 TaxID=3155171 RepID=UPI003446C074
MKGLAGRVALVTGATRGIGRTTAVELALRGAHVLVSGRSVTRGNRVVQGLREAGAQADFLVGELKDDESIKSLGNRAPAIGGGRIDILVNSAGIGHVPAAENMTADVYDAAFRVNVRAAFLLVAEIVPRMALGGEGTIVDVTSSVGMLGIPGQAVYGASKAALGFLAKAWAVEYGPRRVRVNAVAPDGPVQTTAVNQRSAGGRSAARAALEARYAAAHLDGKSPFRCGTSGPDGVLDAEAPSRKDDERLSLASRTGLKAGHAELTPGGPRLRDQSPGCGPSLMVWR